MALLKQSTTYTRTFKMIDSGDHFSAKTGLTPTVSLSKAGGSFSGAGGTVAEIANGWYSIALTTTDTNTLGDLAYYITAATADDTDFTDEVVAFDPQGLIYANIIQYASGTVPAQTKLGYPSVNVLYYSSGTVRTPTIDGIPGVDVKYFSGGTSITPNKIGVPIVDVQYYTGATTNSLISGRVDANAQVVGDKTGYQLNSGVNVTQWASGTTPSTNVAGVPKIDIIYANGTTLKIPISQRLDVNAQVVGDKTGYSLSSPQTVDITGNITGNLSGSVGSVTGAVGSVTGNVSGNVVGSVDSVTAPVKLAAGVNVTQWTSGTTTTNVSGIPRVDLVFTNGTSPTIRVRKNTVYTNFTFPMIDSTDDISLKTGETVTGEVSKDGATFASLTNSVTEIGTTGIYKVDLAATDLNANEVMLKFTSAGANPTLVKIVTQV